MKRRIIYIVLCVLITLGSIAFMIFRFSGSIGRLIESSQDVGLSFGYYFAEIFHIPHNIMPTVNALPKIPFFDFLQPGLPGPSGPLPETFDEFKRNWSVFWDAWASGENFIAYLAWIGNAVFFLSQFLLLIIPLFVLISISFRGSLRKQNNDYNRDSKPLVLWKRLTVKCQPIQLRVKDFIRYVREHRPIYTIWLLIWLVNFNVITILLEFLAFYLYFIVSFDFIHVYMQVYKLFLDLSTIFLFLPLWIWVVVAFIVLIRVCNNRAFNQLYHFERKNRGFINERGVVTIVYGPMGIGKTEMVVDMALSAEVQLRDQAFEIILESDLKFPYFPWINLEMELKRAIEYHKVFDIPSCRRWVRKKSFRWNREKNREKIFDYDYERYGLVYHDNLKLEKIWNVLEEYACAYFIYTVQSSLLIANCSIRVDHLFLDLGNFPRWNSDFFRKDSRLTDSYSRHAHILDFDMLRLGRKMLENNPNRNAFGFGVYVVTEIDKERKNTLELKEIKASEDRANQKNDLFNVLWKMSRHACVIANRVFIKMFADLQRPESLGADARELGEVIYIQHKSEIVPTLPFFSPFYYFEIAYLWLYHKFVGMYHEFRYFRADNTLFVYLFKGFVSSLHHHNERVYHQFGYRVLQLDVERGTLDGKVKKAKYYLMTKKIRSRRYATDCLSGIFERRAEDNQIGIHDIIEYQTERAAPDELDMQNSFMQQELNELWEDDHE